VCESNNSPGAGDPGKTRSRLIEVATPRVDEVGVEGVGIHPARTEVPHQQVSLAIAVNVRDAKEPPGTGDPGKTSPCLIEVAASRVDKVRVKVVVIHPAGTEIPHHQAGRATAVDVAETNNSPGTGNPGKTSPRLIEVAAPRIGKIDVKRVGIHPAGAEIAH